MAASLPRPHLLFPLQSLSRGDNIGLRIVTWCAPYINNVSHENILKGYAELTDLARNLACAVTPLHGGKGNKIVRRQPIDMTPYA